MSKSLTGNIANIEIEATRSPYDSQGNNIVDADRNKNLALAQPPSTEINIRIYATTSVAPRSGGAYLFFTPDDDGNGPAFGYWDGTNLFVAVALQITDN